jgi:MraZ protein
LKKENISSEVTIVGVLDHFELWDRNAWNKYYEENYERDEEIAETLTRRKDEE